MVGTLYQFATMFSLPIISLNILELVGCVTLVTLFLYFILCHIQWIFNILYLIASPFITCLTWNQTKKTILKQFTEQTVCITGGSGEVGTSLAIQFARKNIKNIVLIDINYKTLETVSLHLSQNYSYIPILIENGIFYTVNSSNSSSNSTHWHDATSFLPLSTILESADAFHTYKFCICIVQDVSVYSYLRNAYYKACEFLRIPSIDILINNAAIALPATISSAGSESVSSENVLEQTLATNTISAFSMTQIFIESLMRSYILPYSQPVHIAPTSALVASMSALLSDKYMKSLNIQKKADISASTTSASTSISSSTSSITDNITLNTAISRHTKSTLRKTNNITAADNTTTTSDPLNAIQESFKKWLLQSQYQIITIASAAGSSYAVGLGPYCASKSALIALHKSTRLELSRVAMEGSVSIGKSQKLPLFPRPDVFSQPSLYPFTDITHPSMSPTLLEFQNEYVPQDIDSSNASKMIDYYTSTYEKIPLRIPSLPLSYQNNTNVVNSRDSQGPNGYNISTVAERYGPGYDSNDRLLALAFSDASISGIDGRIIKEAWLFQRIYRYISQMSFKWLHITWFYPLLWIFSTLWNRALRKPTPEQFNDNYRVFEKSHNIDVGGSGYQKSYSLASHFDVIPTTNGTILNMSPPLQNVPLSNDFLQSINPIYSANAKIIAKSIRTVLVTPWKIKTKMFYGISSYPIVDYFFPALDPLEDIAVPIVDDIKKAADQASKRGFAIHEHVEKTMPIILQFLLPFLSLLPTIIADGLTGFVGGWNGMDTFEGKF